MKSLRPFFSTVLIGALVIASTGYPLGIVAAIFVIGLAFVLLAAHLIIEGLNNMWGGQRLAKRNLLQENALRMRQHHQRLNRLKAYQSKLDRIPTEYFSGAIGFCVTMAVCMKINPGLLGVILIFFMASVASHEIAPYTLPSKSR